VKTWIGIANNYIELSYFDILKLLLGRELRPQLPGELIIRQPTAYSAFNLSATPPALHPETDADLRQRMFDALRSAGIEPEASDPILTVTGARLDRTASLHGIKRKGLP
jgi:hypothetical protein